MNALHQPIVAILAVLRASYDSARPIKGGDGHIPCSRHGKSLLRRNGSCMAATSFHIRKLLPVLASAVGLASGCQHPIPVMGHFQGTANVAAQADVRGEMAIKLPTAVDPGPMVASVIRPAHGSPHGAADRRDRRGRRAPESEPSKGLYDSGENPVASFARSWRPRPAMGGSRRWSCGSTAPEAGSPPATSWPNELDRFKAATRKPVVACLMDVATSGAYYLALGADRIVAHPTSLTGGIGGVFNHVNLEDAMAQLNVTDDSIKAGALIDMGTVTKPLDTQSRELFAGDGRRLPRSSSSIGSAGAGRP